MRCRVMMSENGPSPGADASSWLDLKAGASMSVKVSETGRELRFEGPGRVKPCASDGALVVEGSAIGLPGAGEGPGAEQWVATACGVAVWNGGVHRFSASTDDCRLQSSTDSCHLYVSADMVGDDVAVDGGVPEAGASNARAPIAAAKFSLVAGRRTVRLHPKSPLARDTAVKNALAECTKAATDAETVGARLRGGEAGAPKNDGFGELAVQSIGVRRVARAACAVAAVRIARAGDKPADVAALAAAEARFR